MQETSILNLHREQVSAGYLQAFSTNKKFRITDTANEHSTAVCSLNPVLELAAKIQDLDTKILGVISSTLEEEDCLKEVEEVSRFMEEIDDILYDIDSKLEKRILPARSLESIASSSATTKQTRAKLPKHELQKFDGKQQNWFQFWDSFCGVVDNNKELHDAMKCQYLKNHS